jgi:hypothetical protein
MTYSKNGIALAVIVIEALLTAIGVEFEAGTVERAAEGIVVTIALILAVWNQVDRTDVSAFLWKK